jgi:hypothetical protein
MNDWRRDASRWLDADRHGRDDEADEACRELFTQVLPPSLVPAPFTSETMARLAAARAADAERARRARLVVLWTSLTAGPVAIYFGAGAAMSAVTALLVGALNLLVNAAVSAASLSDWSVWSLVGSLGRALAAIMSDADVTFIVVAMHGIAFAALIALQRLLGPDTESYK